MVSDDDTVGESGDSRRRPAMAHSKRSNSDVHREGGGIEEIRAGAH